jgi:hypothetical protein
MIQNSLSGTTKVIHDMHKVRGTSMEWYEENRNLNLSSVRGKRE